jgi:hypothetical protein
MSAFDTVAAQDYESLLSGPTTDHEPGGSCRTRFDLDDIKRLSSRLKSVHAGNKERLLSQEACVDLTVDLAQKLAIELRTWSKEIRELRDEPASRMAQIIQDVSTITSMHSWMRMDNRTRIVARYCERRSSPASENLPSAFFLVTDD